MPFVDTSSLDVLPPEVESQRTRERSVRSPENAFSEMA